MAAQKILRNTSGASRSVLYVQLANEESIDLPFSQWAKLADSQLVLDDIAAGLVTVNNGVSDLTPLEGVAYARTIGNQTAAEVPFNPGSTTLTASNVEQAVIQASSSPFGYNIIGDQQLVTIQLYQQMVVHDEILFDGSGELTVNGEFVVFDERF